MPTVSEILEHKGAEVAVIDENATVFDAARLMHARHIGALVVIEGDRPVAIFTERDLLNRVVAVGRDATTTRVAEVMSTPINTCRRDTPLTQCQALMSNMRLRHLPVVEDGKLVGIVSSGDITAWRVRTSETVVEQLSEYIYGRS